MTEHREFERLVARIEGALTPEGAAVKSPDYVLDQITGEQREVDVSIRFTVGSVRLLITVECRDRARMEDVTWIEQLATKQRHIGAAHTVAVSSTGFSEPALKAARLHGISTRTIEDVSDADILAWADTLEVEEVNTSCDLGRMSLEYDGSYPGAHVDAPSEQDWKARGWDATIFVDRVKDVRLSLSDLVSNAARETNRSSQKARDSVSLTIPPLASMSLSNDPLAIIASDAPTDGSTIARTVWLQVVNEEIAVGTTHGMLNVRKIGFEVTMSSTGRRVPARRVVSYSGEGRTIAEAAEREVDLGSKSGRFVLTQYRTVTHGDSDSQAT